MNTTTELIPSSDLSGLETALIKVEALTAQLDPLKQRAESIVVDSASNYAAIGGVLSEVRALRKAGAAEFAPFVAIVDRVKTFLRTKLLVNQNACEIIEATCTRKMKEWEQRERAAAEAEQAKLNKTAARRGEQPVEVQAALPTVAGYRKTRNYRAEFVEGGFDRLLKEFRTTKDKERLRFLRQFIAPDMTALAQYARSLKDPKAVESSVPGTRAWED